MLYHLYNWNRRQRQPELFSTHISYVLVRKLQDTEMIYNGIHGI